MENKPTIILTDDDEDDRDFFKMAVESNNMSYNLLMFPDGKSLLDYLVKSEVILSHIIFLDINMPILNGYEVLNLIRQLFTPQQLPVVMYTTSNSDDDRKKSLKEGANMFLLKPNDFKELKAMISDVIGKLTA